MNPIENESNDEQNSNNQLQELNNPLSEEPESPNNNEMDQNDENQNEEFLLQQKINLFLQQNQFAELSAFLNINKSKLSQNLLTNYISIVLEFYKCDINILNAFLSNGANVNSAIHSASCEIEEKDGINLLMYSIITNNMELFNTILKYKPNVLLEDKHKKNSVVYSILFNEDNNPQMLKEILKLDSNAINTIFHDQETNITHNLITLATSKNKKNIVEILLSEGGDVNYQIPSNGDTAMHIAVRNDNLEIAEILSKNEKIDRNIQNKSGETATHMAKEKKGKIFFQLVAKEQSSFNNNVNNNLIKMNPTNDINNNHLNNIPNNNNLLINNNLNNNQNQNTKKKKDKKEKTNEVEINHDTNNNNNNNNNIYTTNQKNSKEDLIIPIEFKSFDYPSYLSIGQDIKLYLNLFQSEDILNQRIEELEKQLKEKTELMKNYESLIEDKQKELSDLNHKTEKIEEEIKKQKKINSTQQNQIKDITNQNKDFTKLLTSLNIISEENKPAQKPENDTPKNENDPNSILNYLTENPISEEEYKFLERKFHSESYDQNYIVNCLQKDLTDYQSYVKDQISLKFPVIQEILAELQAAVNEINPDYKVNLYGSYCTGLCLPWSDIDTVLTCEGSRSDECFLGRLYMKLTSKPWVKEHKFIENTAIPLIKLVSNDKFNFHIDISEESEKHFGLKTVELVKSYLKTYSVLEPIILALKTLLNNGNLNNPYTGGLSSYGLILMVVSFIQSEIDNGKYNENSPTILGETFLNVLGHYGIFFDYNNYVIITYLVDDTNDTSDRDNSFAFGPNSHELIIVDPLNKQNNVAKSTFQFMNIKMGFLIAFMVAKEDCECGCHYGYIQNNKFNTEHCILKRIFNSIKRFKDANKNIY